MSASSLSLGAFELLGVVGRGGMGEVWRATHTISQTPVAIKAVARERACDEDFISGFVQEVYAVAALDHPGIVRVLDHGIIDAKAATQSGQKLTEGSPWLAMEFAPSGSLDSYKAIASWEELKALLCQLLRALAHAHSRDIVHRDLKPGNVLVGHTSQGNPRYMLTDFGLAHVLSEHVQKGSFEERMSSSGTPAYMPPEQLAGHWRQYGAWTDLYALGCMAYELCCGSVPFHETQIIRLAHQHMTESRPPLTPRFEVPKEFEGWVHQLMAIHIGHRPFRAYDALWGLENLAPTPTIAPTQTHRATASHESKSIFFAPTIAPSLEHDPTVAMTHKLSSMTMDSLSMVDQHAVPRRDLISAQDIPFVTQWEELGRTTSSEHNVLSGVGLGLFGLRESPVMDRIKERHHIWHALERVHSTHNPELIMITGPAGAGKSRLCQWASRKSHETGNGTELIMLHHQERTASDGLLPSLKRHLRCDNLSRAEAFERLQMLFSTFVDTERTADRVAHEAALMTELFYPYSAESAPPDDGTPRAHIHGVLERHKAQLAALDHIASVRPVVLWMDDAHWSKDSLEIAQKILEAQLPVLILISTPHLQAGPHVELLGELAAHPQSSTLELEPLRPTTHHAFISQMLGFTPHTAKHIATHTHGNPLLATQVISDWIARGDLVMTPEGFAHVSGDEPSIPASLRELWTRKLEHLQDLEEAMWEVPLFIAAALGPYFSQQLWLSLCRTLKAPCSMTLQQALFARGMFKIVAPDLVTWGHSALRTKVLRDAKHRGPWLAIHRAIAVELAPLRRTVPQRQRYMQHMLHAGQESHALDELAAIAKQALDQSDYDLAGTLISGHQRLCDWLMLPSHDARRLTLIPLLITSYRVKGNLKQAIELATRTLPHLPGASPDTALIRADTLRAITMIHYLEGAYETSRDTGNEAIALYREHKDYYGLLKALHTQGWLLTRVGDFAGAMTLFRQGDEIGEVQRDEIDRAWCVQAIADLHIQHNKPKVALEAAELAIALFEQGGSRAGLALALCSRADVYALHNQIDEAKHHYTIADNILTALDINLRFVSHSKLAIIALLQHDFDLADMHVRRVLDIKGSNQQLSVRTYLVQCAIAVHRKDHAAAEAHLRRAHDILQFASYAYLDMVEVLQHTYKTLLAQNPPKSLLSAFRNMLARQRHDQLKLAEALDAL